MEFEAVFVWLKIIGVLLATPIFIIFDATKRYIKPPKSFQSRIVLITGAASGLGKRLSQICGNEGANLILVDRNKQGLKEVESELSKFCSVRTYECDLSDKDNLNIVFNKIVSENDKISILINCAGIVSGKLFAEISDDQYVKVIDVNLGAYVRTTRICLDHMTDDGHLVYISSLAGLAGMKRMTDYSASKCAVTGFCDSLRFELQSRKPQPIIVTCIYPYVINTGMFEGAKSPITEMLNEDYVCDQIIDSIKKEDEHLIIPWWGFLLSSLRCLPPTQRQCIFSISRAHEIMDTFEHQTKEN